MPWRRSLRCSFCGKDERQVAKLVAGPRVYICDGCAALAQRIMDGAAPPSPPPASRSGLWRWLRGRIGPSA